MNLRTRRKLVIALGLAAAWSAGPLPAVADSELSLVVCAPGYPSSTEQAQPSMDELAAGLTGAIGRPVDSLDATYFPDLEDGLAALGAGGADLAMVPLPFYLEYAAELKLRPLLQVETLTGAEEVWSLVARAGALKRPADLDGWQVVGMPGYSPGFVRSIALSGWGALPESTSIGFDGRVLGVLRKAARGEPLAAILDRAQADSLDALPFGADLEVVTRSEPVVGSVVCAVGGALGDERAAQVSSGFLKLHAQDGGAELLESLRLTRFVPLDVEALQRAESDFSRTDMSAR